MNVNYHTLADFEVGPAEYLDGIFSTSVAALMAEGFVDLQRVTQDGVRVRAEAGSRACFDAERALIGPASFPTARKHVKRHSS